MIIWITTFSLLVSFTFAATETFTTCFPHFDCVEFTSEWFNSTMRPTNLPPLDRIVINTKFLYLYPNQASKTINYDLISTHPKTVKITTYNNHYALIILIHDFTSNGYTGWVKHMAMEIALLDRYNIISIDWQEGAEPPYLQAICNARVVALEIVHLLKMLEKSFDLVMNDIHLIGHGVGAHVAGYVGKIMEGKIGRITGLDPTGPYFEGMPPAVRLNQGDALYVEVIHTDGEGKYRQGTMQPLGNIDFYFNNGTNQLGCRNLLSPISILKVERDKLREGTVLPDCNHKRAFKYYIEAIKGTDATRSCSFLAVPLGTPINKLLNFKFSDYSRNPIQSAGIGLSVDKVYFAKQVNAKYEVWTAPYNPFCKLNVILSSPTNSLSLTTMLSLPVNYNQVEIEFAKCKEAEEQVNGYFNLTLKDKDGNNISYTINQFKNDSQVIIHGSNITFHVQTRGPIVEKIANLTVTWHFTKPYCFKCHNSTCVEKFRLGHIRTFIKGVDEPKISEFCPPNDKKYMVLYDNKPYSRSVDCYNNKQKVKF